jgi:hypothetical protein
MLHFSKSAQIGAIHHNADIRNEDYMQAIWQADYFQDIKRLFFTCNLGDHNCSDGDTNEIQRC